MREFSVESSYIDDGIVEKLTGWCGDLGDDVNLLLGWFLEVWKKKWFRVSEVEMLEFLWKVLEIGLKGFE